MIQCHCRICGRDFERFRRRGNLDVCSRCSGNARVSAWKRANPERTKQHSGYSGSNEAKKRYAVTERGKQVTREKASRFYHKDVERSRARNREVQARAYPQRRDMLIQHATNRKKHVKRATPVWADMKAIAAVYKRARRMSEESGIAYSVDHIVPLRNKHVSGLHVDYNLQILTLAENCLKRNNMPVEQAGT